MNPRILILLVAFLTFCVCGSEKPNTFESKDTENEELLDELTGSKDAGKQSADTETMEDTETETETVIDTATETPIDTDTIVEEDGGTEFYDPIRVAVYCPQYCNGSGSWDMGCDGKKIIEFICPDSEQLCCPGCGLAGSWGDGLSCKAPEHCKLGTIHPDSSIRCDLPAVCCE